ncbi:MAG: hypothetical protein AAGJ94_05805 [Pseudomonadota bacterium]
MDMRVGHQTRAGVKGGVVAGFHDAGRATPSLAPDIVWSNDENALYAADISAFVIADCRLLSDLTLALTVGRPTLFLIDNPTDLAHLHILQTNREIVLTPLDGIYAPAGLPPVDGLREHVIIDPEAWILGRGRAGVLPGALRAFHSLTKANFGEFARKGSSIVMPNVQQFWRLVGEHGVLAQTLMPTPRMIRVGVGGPFNGVTPTLIFVDPRLAGALQAITLRQSTIVIAPFAVPIGDAVDSLFADFVDARTEPFHLHDVLTFGDRDGTTIGCLYGEYIL